MSQRGSTPGQDERDYSDKNGIKNGDANYEGISRNSRRRRRTPSVSSESDRSRSRSGSKSGSKSRHSKKRKIQRRSRSHSSSGYNRRASRLQRKLSRSRSPSPRDRESRRRYSRSPSFGKPRMRDEREPVPSRVLGIFGMSVYTDENRLGDYFSQFGTIENIQIIYDRKTCRSRGFGFIYFKRTEDAILAKERAIGTEIDGQRVRIDYSLTDRPHAPTPGQYMGRRRDSFENFGHGRFGGSPPYRRRRSRSHSYSPRR